MKKWDEHNKLFKGKIPYWQNKIKEYITKDGYLVKEKILRDVEYNEVFPINSRLLPNTRIDRRTKQWVIAKTSDPDGKTVYGLIISNKKDVRINHFIKLRHYLPIPHNNKKLCLKLCVDVNC